MAAKKPIHIRLKIFFYLISFCAILLAILWLSVVVFLDDFYKSIKAKEITKCMSTIAESIDSEYLKDVIVDAFSRYDMQVEIVGIDNNSAVKFSSDRSSWMLRLPVMEYGNILQKTKDNGGELLQYLEIKREIPSAPNQASIRGKEGENGLWEKDPPLPARTQHVSQTLLNTKIVTNSAGQQYLIILTTMLTPIDATVNTIRILVFFIAGAMFVISLVIAFLMSNWISKPIISINQSAKELSKGNFDVVFQGKGYYEINELSDVLNHTAKELSKVESLRRELIANISHDLRTPLTLITGYAEAMKDLPGEMTQENVQVIIDESKWLSSLVSDVLDLSKIQAGTAAFEPHPYCLTESLRQTADRFAELVKAHGYTVSFEYDGEAYVSADETKITQAVYNLLTNAIQYSGEKKSVAITQTKREGKVKVEIKDSGEGISETDLPYIWDRYYKSNKAHKRNVLGTGIGLSLVKTIFEQHHLDYGVFTSSEGSTFWAEFALIRTENMKNNKRSD